MAHIHIYIVNIILSVYTYINIKIQFLCSCVCIYEYISILEFRVKSLVYQAVRDSPNKYIIYMFICILVFIVDLGSGWLLLLFVTHIYRVVGG